MKTVYLLLGLLAMLVGSAFAQDDPLLLLVDSIDPQSGQVSLIWLDLSAGNQRSITSFNTNSYCPPTVWDNKLYYEPFTLEQPAYTFQIDLQSGAILPLDAAQQLSLHCPVLNPLVGSVAWLRKTEEQTEIVVTNADGSNPVVLSAHRTLYDALWSPDGEILIYTAVDADATFRPLYAHASAKTAFWARDAGLVIDYVWVPDGSALVVAYYTQENAVVGLLERDCVLNGGCYPTPLAAFDLRLGLRLTDAFAPDASGLVVIAEEVLPGGELSSDLYRVDLNAHKQRLTTTPTLIETGAIWVEELVYFIGAVYDAQTLTVTESGVYMVSQSGGDSSPLYTAEGFYPVQIIWSNANR